MTGDLFILAGGVGMFLLGMDVMTRALREAAGSRLRGLLARFTTTPLRGVLTGAAATAVIQSSSATTVMTVGFVGAGLLSMGQALGIVFGANIGTTATGWLVSVLGFRLNLESVAQIALLPASLALLLGRGALARGGRAVAGLCLLLIGLGLMQEGMGDATRWVTPESLPGRGAAGLLVLALTGLAVTVLIQSSSAAVALALVMLDGGAIGPGQAAAMVVGMNVGTTFTALLASVGGSRAMRQTAVANLLFNLLTAVAVLPALWVGGGLLEDLAAATDPLTALLLFHSGFNIAGTAAFLPFTRQYARLVARLVPERAADRAIRADRGVLDEPEAALDAARAAALAIARRMFAAYGAALRDPPDWRGLSALEPAAGAALDDLGAYLADIRLPPDRADLEARYAALLHAADHLRRLLWRASQKGRIPPLLSDPVSRRPALLAGAIFRRAAQGAHGAALPAARLHRLQQLVARRARRHRRGLLTAERAGTPPIRELFAHTDAMRWLDRVLHHAARIGHYDRIAHSDPRRPQRETG